MVEVTGRAPLPEHPGGGALLPREEYAALDECTYLNQASLGLVPRSSVDAMTAFLREVGQHGNVLLSDADETRVLDGVRSGAAQLLDAPMESVAVLGGASEGLGQIAAVLAAQMTHPAPEIVLVSTDFPSVTYPWLAAAQRPLSSVTPVLRWVHDEPSSSLTAQLVDAIGDRTAVVYVSAVQYSTGTAVDMEAIVTAARDVGARVVADVTQLAGAGPVSLRTWGVDAMVCSGYKWLSAHGGVAVAAMTDEMSSAVPPVVGWMGAEEPFEFDATALHLARGARRYELSTMSYASAVGLQRSLGLLNGIGMPALADHARHLAEELVDLVAPAGWRPFRPLHDASASPHIVSLRHDEIPGAAAQAALAREHRVFTSSRVGGVRVSLHGYNTTADVHALADALSEFSRQR